VVARGSFLACGATLDRKVQVGCSDVGYFSRFWTFCDQCSGVRCLPRRISDRVLGVAEVARLQRLGLNSCEFSYGCWVV
jgi:hypothetical protein